MAKNGTEQGVPHDRSDVMQLLAQIKRSKHVPTLGRTVTREAVRAIILRDGEMLLVYIPQIRSYKLPGGGINSNESHGAALIREVDEECGATVTRIGAPFGKVIEYDVPVEAEFDIFAQTSYYYLCHVSGTLGAQHLEAYEAALGFDPVWVRVEVALAANEEALRTRNHTTPRWIERETLVLRRVTEAMASGLLGGHKPVLPETCHRQPE